ncbi:MAG TPA: hypothetical protein VGE32_13195 [Cellvibrio sp.]
MDKDNLEIKRIFSRFSDEPLRSIQHEALHQMLTAFIVMIVGVLLTAVGLVGIIVRLVRLAGFGVLTFAQHLGLARHVNVELERRHFHCNRRKPEYR